MQTPPSTLTTPASSAALTRLSRFLRAHSGQFALGLIRATADGIQKELLDWIRGYCSEHGLRVVILERGQLSPGEFVRQIESASGPDSVFVFTGTEREFLASGELGALLNRQREQFPRWFPGPVLLLLGDRLMDKLLIDAPDLMDWHAATFSFELPSVAIPIDRDRSIREISDRSTESIEGTIQVLRDQVKSAGLSTANEARAFLELARLYDVVPYSLPRDPGYQRRFSFEVAADLSRDSAKEAIRRFRELGAGNDFAYAKPLADALDVLAGYEAKRGDRLLALESAREAVMFRRAAPNAQSEEALAALAFSLDKLATALEENGQHDEALRICQNELLPAFEKLGDVRSRAVTQGKIADIRMARGDLDEALRICQNELLPAFEKLGDVRSRAVTQGKIADIRMARGDLDEALRIRLEEELPVYEKLGDVRSRAVTQGKIADIRMARGDLDEALRIRLEE
ncbi:MAG: tetratricopeptide repeat protein, partial [Acidobacteria bacterium]|nr:tetratricopeptide repeat protein [Acidobacteriota bacterium]